MIIGGRQFEWTKEQVEASMRGESPEVIHQHVVEMLGAVFPPKQVLATVTGWDRSTFTTLEAQRALLKLGFVCRRATAGGVPAGGAWATVEEPDQEEKQRAVEPDRLGALEAGLATAMEAIASLRSRVQALEAK